MGAASATGIVVMHSPARARCQEPDGYDCRSRWLLLQQPDTHGLDGGLRAVGDAELAEDALDVLLGRGDAPAHAVGDLTIGEPLSDQTQDLAIDRSQLIGRGRR